jgi:oligopeptide/dipeptide ABC transporter ATP-binding protein
MSIALNVQNLSIDYLTQDGKSLHAVEDVSFQVRRGRSLALVGESGCGKTTTMLALLRLLPEEGRITAGKILYGDVDLLQLSEAQMRAYRWSRIAMVFQGAMNALNPVRKVGDQIAEAILGHDTLTSRQARAQVGGLLSMVGISPDRANQYPHQFSGGMRQRAMIAMALACNPDILIADEPTTALDVMIQAQILDLLKRLQTDLGLSVILVTHDLGVVAELCDDVVIMYGGKVAEYGEVDAVFNHPRHPYTYRLLQAFPDVDSANVTLTSIPGHPPLLSHLPPGCRFEPRCHRRTDVCATASPALTAYGTTQLAACYHPEEG